MPKQKSLPGVDFLFFSIIFFALMFFGFAGTLLAANQDLVLYAEKVQIPEFALEGKSVRLYATVTSLSDEDHKGVIRFFTNSAQLGADQPISVLAGSEDNVFINVELNKGTYEILVRLFPFDAESDDPANNIVRKTLRVVPDADRDGKPDETDPDDDNDGALDGEDAFPLDRRESIDSDGDGAGNNRDEDDDNDGVKDETDCSPLDATRGKDSDGDGLCDEEDIFPSDPTESHDTDNDGTGDNRDPDADNDGIEKSKDANDQNVGPKIKLSGVPVLPTVDKPIRMSLSETSDPDGEIKNIVVVVSRVGRDDTFLLPISPDRIIEFTPRSAGPYEIRITAVDDKNESREETVKIAVRNPAFVYGIFAALLGIIGLAMWRLFAYSSRRTHERSELDPTKAGLSRLGVSRSAIIKMTKSSPKGKKSRSRRR